MIERDSEVRYASPATSRVLGFEPTELEGMRFVELVHPDDKTRVLAFLTASGDDDGHTGLIEFRVRLHLRTAARLVGRTGLGSQNDERSVTEDSDFWLLVFHWFHLLSVVDCTTFC